MPAYSFEEDNVPGAMAGGGVATARADSPGAATAAAAAAAPAAAASTRRRRLGLATRGDCARSAATGRLLRH